jgi:isopentenyl-diphosphate delta-isomerase
VSPLRHEPGGPIAGADAIPAIRADGALFPIGKLQAHQTGQLHLAVSVFLFCEGEMLMQRRAAGKYHCGGLWANSCCTHPHWGEALADCAQRRIREELGVSPPLTAAGVLTYRTAVDRGLIEHERVQVFQAEVDKSRMALSPDPNEVMQTRWASPEVLAAEIRAQPQAFAPWFQIYMSRWDALGFVTECPSRALDAAE